MTEKQRNRETDKQTVTGKQGDDRQTKKHRDTQTKKQRDRQTKKQTNGNIEKQTQTETH